MSLHHFGKGALRVAKNYTKGYSNTQVKVRDATSNDIWGASGTEMNEIAKLSYNQNDFIEIMEMLDKRLNDKGKNWRHVLKSLTVLDYLLHVGSENVVLYFRDNLYIIKTLKEFQYIDEDGKDCGANVRQKAEDISNLLSDPARLQEERRTRASMRSRIDLWQGNGYGKDNEDGGRKSYAPPETSPRKIRGVDHDDEEIRKAIKASQNVIAEEQTREVEEHALATAARLNVHATPETGEGKDRAGDKDEENDDEADLLDQQQRDVYFKQSPLPEPEGSICPDAESSLHTTASQRRSMISAPQVSFVQTESDTHSSVHTEAILQDLTHYIMKAEDHAVDRGGFGEIWKCTYQMDQGPIKQVAVKSLLVYTSDQLGKAMEKKTKRIRHELRTCAGLKHANILPVYGYTYGFGIFMAIVSPWAENGNLTTYLENEDASLSVVRRFQILRDITAGLQYLHANNVIHGDLTGPNVLIYGDGTACLADFGLSLVCSDVISVSQASWTSNFHGNFRWLAPELLGEQEDELPVRPNKHSDIYSFGSIMLQVLTSKIPYYYLVNNAAVIRCIFAGDKPHRSRYPAFSDQYWHFIEECWSAGPQNRPSAERVVEVIRDELNSL